MITQNLAFQDVTQEFKAGDYCVNAFSARFINCVFAKGVRFCCSNLALAQFINCRGVENIMLHDKCRCDGIVGLDVDRAAQDSNSISIKGKGILPPNISAVLDEVAKVTAYDEALAAGKAIPADAMESKTRMVAIASARKVALAEAVKVCPMMEAYKIEADALPVNPKVLNG